MLLKKEEQELVALWAVDYEEVCSTLLMTVEAAVGKEVLDLVDFQAEGNLDNLDKPR